MIFCNCNKLAGMRHKKFSLFRTGIPYHLSFIKSNKLLQIVIDNWVMCVSHRAFKHYVSMVRQETCTTALAEHSFSKFKLIKSYLRGTLAQ